MKYYFVINQMILVELFHLTLMKKTINKKTEIHSRIIEDLTVDISPEEQNRADRKMQLAVKIGEAMRTAGLRKGQLARLLHKNPSEITKWLSGTHNFTVETLWDIGDVLGIDLVNIDEQDSEWEYVLVRKRRVK